MPASMAHERPCSNYFSRKLGRKVSQSSIHSFKWAYLKSMKENRGDSSDEDIAELPHKKRGRPFLLGKDIDEQVQLYLHKIQENGGVITASVAVSAAKGIMKSCDVTQLAEFGGHIETVGIPFAKSNEVREEKGYYIEKQTYPQRFRCFEESIFE